MEPEADWDETEELVGKQAADPGNLVDQIVGLEVGKIAEEQSFVAAGIAVAVGIAVAAGSFVG